MKTFELSERKNKNGRRKFKMVLHEIYPDSCVNDVEQKGEQYNTNGITWIRQYCENAEETIKDMSLRAEFLDDDKTEICGHGETGQIDGLPLFEDAEVIGHFTNGYVDTIKDDDEVEHTVMVGEGYIDEMCYKNLVDKLESDIANGEPPFGSVEIYRAENNDGIVYKYGYIPQGRIPTEFIYSGYALLGVTPADRQAKILELNESKEDVCEMNETEIMALVTKVVEEHDAHINEINKCKEECAAQVAEVNAEKEAVITEKNEIQANSAKIQEALDGARAELEQKYQEIEALHEEINTLRDALGEAKAKERLGEMNAAIANFTDEERAYAKDEIDAFTADPVNSEINSIVDKIWKGIGMKSKAEAAIISEQNDAHETPEDIFSGVEIVDNDKEDTNIF